MSNHTKVKFDTLCLGVLAGLCVLIGIQQMRKMALVNKDAVFYIGQAQKLPADCADVARTYPMGYPFILWAAHKAVLALSGTIRPCSGCIPAKASHCCVGCSL